MAGQVLVRMVSWSVREKRVTHHNLHKRSPERVIEKDSTNTGLLTRLTPDRYHWKSADNGSVMVSRRESHDPGDTRTTKEG